MRTMVRSGVDSNGRGSHCREVARVVRHGRMEIQVPGAREGESS